jgi:hypothetical protein
MLRPRMNEQHPQGVLIVSGFHLKIYWPQKGTKITSCRLLSDP